MKPLPFRVGVTFAQRHLALNNFEDIDGDQRLKIELAIRPNSGDDSRFEVHTRGVDQFFGGWAIIHEGYSG
jgi:hypothetical protein